MLYITPSIQCRGNNVPMSIYRFMSKLLQFTDLKVTGFAFKEQVKELHICVKPYKNGCCCPDCGHRCKIVQQTKKLRCWDDLVVCGWKIILLYAPKEINCPIHGRHQEVIPWALGHAQHTYRHEYTLLTYAKHMTQKIASELLRITSSTFSNRLHRAIVCARKDHKIKELTTLGVDEISYRKGKKFATIVYDLDKSVVLWVGKGKGRETIDRFFKEELTEDQRKAIRWASCDMSASYIGAIEEFCPNVKLVLDHFHIVQALNKAVDEVRKDVWREASKSGRKILKGLRWLLYRRSSTRSKNQTRTLNELKKENNTIYRAWVLKDEFEHFWKYVSTTWAESFLKAWVTRALRSRIEPLKKFARMIRKHQENILTYITRNLTNTKGEGINRIIKIVKNRASGYFNLENFTDMIYLVAGDVDITAQVPKQFRIV